LESEFNNIDYKNKERFKRTKKTIPAEAGIAEIFL